MWKEKRNLELAICEMGLSMLNKTTSSFTVSWNFSDDTSVL